MRDQIPAVKTLCRYLVVIVSGFSYYECCFAHMIHRNLDL
jgi:hypothetical protein